MDNKFRAYQLMNAYDKIKIFLQTSPLKTQTIYDHFLVKENFQFKINQKS